MDSVNYPQPCSQRCASSAPAYNIPAGAPFSHLIGVMPPVEIQKVCRKIRKYETDSLQIKNNLLFPLQKLSADILSFFVLLYYSTPFLIYMRIILNIILHRSLYGQK